MKFRIVAPSFMLFATTLGASALAQTTVSGTVHYAGPPRPAATLPVTQDPAVCGKSKTDDALLLDGAGNVKNAVVSLVGVPGAPKPAPGALTIDQKKCEFSPRVQAAPVGSSLTIGNSDAVLHNVHAWNKGNTVFNLAMPTVDMKLKRKLAQPGLNEFRCDAGHVWMAAYVWGFDHPYYAVTDAGGKFSIAGVPPGKYTLHVWHEGWKRKDAKVPAITQAVEVDRPVVVEEGKPLDVTVDLK